MLKRETVKPEEPFDRIDALLENPAPRLVQAFYHPDVAQAYSTRADFVGELFTTLGDVDPDCFEPEDLIAVHLMGMRFTPTATAALLNAGTQRDTVSNLLSKVPKVDIFDEEADFSAANELWELLTRKRKSVYRGIDWVTAGKLLARKRPQLVPVIDKVVTTLIPRSGDDDYWVLIQKYLRSEGRIEKVESLRPEGVSPLTTPTLRLLDTAIWMRGSKGPAKKIREELGLTD